MSAGQADRVSFVAPRRSEAKGGRGRGRCEDCRDEGNHDGALSYRCPSPARALLPRFRRDIHAAPCPAAASEGLCPEPRPWWLTLEEVVARAEEIELCRNGELWRLPTGTLQEKERSHDQIYCWLRSVDEPRQRRIVRTLADRYEIDTVALCRDLVMNWDEIRTLAADPLVTIGAHTKGHYAIAKLCAEKAIDEVKGGADVLERELGTRPAHFSFPYGDEGSARVRHFALAKELGFKTAVTTRKGVLFPAHKRYLTALPRVSLNGEYQP
jgi:Polysaccharide deacetylase